MREARHRFRAEAFDRFEAEIDTGRGDGTVEGDTPAVGEDDLALGSVDRLGPGIDNLDPAGGQGIQPKVQVIASAEAGEETVGTEQRRINRVGFYQDNVERNAASRQAVRDAGAGRPAADDHDARFRGGNGGRNYRRQSGPQCQFRQRTSRHHRHNRILGSRDFRSAFHDFECV